MAIDKIIRTVEETDNVIGKNGYLRQFFDKGLWIGTVNIERQIQDWDKTSLCMLSDALDRSHVKLYDLAEGTPGASHSAQTSVVHSVLGMVREVQSVVSKEMVRRYKEGR